jgi:cobaltochelatase CobT
MVQPAAFLSYVHSDDDHDRGRISLLRQRLEGEIRMHTGMPFQIFQDRNDLAWGQNWSQRIEKSLYEVTFLIPIITPSYFNSHACRNEYNIFEQREKSLGTNQLILPIYYLSSDVIETQDDSDDMGISLRKRQYSDWRGLRFHPLEGPEAAKKLAEQANMVRAHIALLQEIFEASNHELHASQNDKENIQSTTSIYPALKISDDLEMIVGSLDTEEPESYKIYTHEFDEIINASEFIASSDATTLLDQLTTTASLLKSQHHKSIEKFMTDITTITSLESIAVQILIDNSGSLRGKPILYLSSWILIIVEILEWVGVQCSAVGFTTRAWKGGQSREKWLKDGRPSNPGRLNDLRYIKYKDYDETVMSSVQNISAMLKEGILKENIDGEALQFGQHLVKERKAKKRIIIIFSDGAPVDDSTLSVNNDRILEDHLRSVISEIENSNTMLIAVGVDHNVTRYYGINGINSKIEFIGPDIFKILRKKLDLDG